MEADVIAGGLSRLRPQVGSVVTSSSIGALTRRYQLVKRVYEEDQRK